MRRFGLMVVAAGLWAGLSAAPAHAVLFSATGGGRSATADFSIVNNQLQVVLSNVSTGDVTQPIDVLTGVFFNIASDPAFSSISAVLGQGSTLEYDSSSVNSNIGTGWAYASNLSGAPGGANQGLSAAGLGLFGASTFQGTGNTAENLGGLDYGIASAGDNVTTYNGGIINNPPLIKNAVVFKLGNVPMNFDPSSLITDVTFQYGTALNEPQLVASCTNCTIGGGSSNSPVPEPASLALLGSGLLGFALLRRRRG